jgi:hypothetical protein
MILDRQQLKKLGFMFVEYSQGLPSQHPHVRNWQGGIINDFGVIVHPTFSIWAQEGSRGVHCSGFLTVVVYNIQTPAKKWWRRTIRYDLFNIFNLLPILAINSSQDFCLIVGEKKHIVLISASGKIVARNTDYTRFREVTEEFYG